MATLWRQNLSRSLAVERDFCVILESYAADQVHETRGAGSRRRCDRGSQTWLKAALGKRAERLFNFAFLRKPNTSP